MRCRALCVARSIAVIANPHSIRANELHAFCAFAEPRKAGEHKLHSAWTFWYDKKIKKETRTTESYEKGLIQLGSFVSLEGFWKYYIR